MPTNSTPRKRTARAATQAWEAIRRSDGAGLAVVTGASSGIGREIAKLLAARGYDLQLVARSEGALKELADELQQRYGVVAQPLVADLADPDAAADVVTKASRDGGGIDVLVNNAGVGLHGRFLETDLADELAMIRLNVLSLTSLTKHVALSMAERKKGRILNVASTAAFEPGPLMAAYYATKAYVLSFSEALAEELRSAGVTVTALCPGPTPSGFQSQADTPQTMLLFKLVPMKTPEYVAKVAVKGMFKGKAIVIPGLMNKLQVQSIRFSPRAAVRRMVRVMQEPRGQ